MYDNKDQKVEDDNLIKDSFKHILVPRFFLVCEKTGNLFLFTYQAFLTVGKLFFKTKAGEQPLIGEDGSIYLRDMRLSLFFENIRITSHKKLIGAVPRIPSGLTVQQCRIQLAEF